MLKQLTTNTTNYNRSIELRKSTLKCTYEIYLMLAKEGVPMLSIGVREKNWTRWLEFANNSCRGPPLSSSKCVYV